MHVYKILRASEWRAFQDAESFDGAPVDLADGYIHLSTADQVPGTLAKHFAGEDGLTLLSFDIDSLGPELRWEEARGGAKFPHLYRTLSLGEVTWHCDIPLKDGAPRLPEKLW
ncbi:DUF952 domain-containing protein [Mesobaculum littorinae]|uniref:DUF952 domain-containing protein n=1 Tax=Mesobaculum littorinae TaxID=2486419 RepID=A0A438AK56_9RHOB|nr:DUF952 domain-containing protein [Mesobaculum littorinae]RVV99062.1 DUF952 domain-containing protein [Mesobaculum littorinae]